MHDNQTVSAARHSSFWPLLAVKPQGQPQKCYEDQGNTGMPIQSPFTSSNIHIGSLWGLCLTLDEHSNWTFLAFRHLCTLDHSDSTGFRLTKSFITGPICSKDSRTLLLES
jgi:hypothetical protein